MMGRLARTIAACGETAESSTKKMRVFHILYDGVCLRGNGTKTQKQAGQSTKNIYLRNNTAVLKPNLDFS